MSVLTDFPDYSEHVAIANQVAATGAPLIGKPSLLLNDTGRTIVGGGTFSELRQPVTGISYHVKIGVQFPAAATVPFVEVRFSWFSTAAGGQINTDNFVIPGNTSGGGFVVFGGGPVKADALDVSLINLDPAQTATVSVSIVQDSIVQSVDDWRWANTVNAGTTVPTFTLPTLPNDEKSLGMINSAITASGSLVFLFGMFDGPIGVGVQAITVAPSALSIFFQAVPTVYYQGNNALGNVIGPNPGVFEIAGTRSPVKVTVINTSTVAGTVALALTAKR